MMISHFDIPKRFENAEIGNFIIDSNNKAAAHAINNIQPGQSITLTGTTGTGKTHLAISALKLFPNVTQSQAKAEKDKQNAEYYLKFGSEEDKQNAQRYLDTKAYLRRKPKTAFVPVLELFVMLNEASYGTGKLQLLDDICNFDLLVLDDLGAEKLTEASRQNLYYLIDKRYRDIKSTIVTTNYQYADLFKVEPRIASRLAEMGQIFEIKGKDRRVNR